MGGGRCSAAPKSSRAIPTGGVTCCSTNISMATTAPASAPVIKPAGPGRGRPVSKTSGTSVLRPISKPAAPPPSNEYSVSKGIGAMATTPRYPSLLQINTRVWLQGLSREAGKRVTLAEISDETIGGWAAAGFDWIWLLSAWQTGAAGRRISRDNPQWRDEFKTVLPDLTHDDTCASAFPL